MNSGILIWAAMLALLISGIVSMFLGGLIGLLSAINVIGTAFMLIAIMLIFIGTLVTVATYRWFTRGV